MTALTKLRTFLVAVLLAFSVVPGARSQGNYCAFEILVKSPSGAPIEGAGVAGLDQNGIGFGTAVTDSVGLARICDSAPGLTDIQVGGQRCGAVTVRYLRPYWMVSRKVFVTYTNCSGEDHTPPAGCLLTIRVKAGDGAPLAGVRFVASSETPAHQTAVSDQYGRIFRFIRFGDTMAGRLVKDGYLEKELNEPCVPGKAYRLERAVELRERVRLP